jgi:hypothetical protein
LASAIEWYSDGFSERSGIKVDLEMPPSLDRLPQDLELTIYRLVQEGLTNIHRHSGSKWAPPSGQLFPVLKLFRDANRSLRERDRRWEFGGPFLTAGGVRRN